MAVNAGLKVLIAPNEGLITPHENRTLTAGAISIFGDITNRVVMNDKLKVWQDRSAYTLAEAALLITGAFPDDWKDKLKLLSAPPLNFTAIYGQIRIDATTIVDEGLSQEVEGEWYTVFALETDYTLGTKKISEDDGFDVVVSKDEIRKWTERRDYPRVFNDGYVLKASTVKPESTQKTNNLLKALTAIAIDQYGYKPDSEKSTAPKEISDAMASVGVELDPKTIRGYLKEGSGLIELPEHLKS